MTRRLRRRAATPGPGAEEAPTAATGGGPARPIPRQEEGVMPEKRAFWDNDRYPFILHGPVDKIITRKDGVLAKVKNYGGAVFQHFATLDEPKGEQLVFALESLGSDFDRESRELRERYHSVLQAILNVYKVEHPRAHILFKKETTS